MSRDNVDDLPHDGCVPLLHTTFRYFKPNSNQWKARVILTPTSESLASAEAFIMTTLFATSVAKWGIMRTGGFQRQCRSYVLHLDA